MLRWIVSQASCTASKAAPLAAKPARSVSSPSSTPKPVLLISRWIFPVRSFYQKPSLKFAPVRHYCRSREAFINQAISELGEVVEEDRLLAEDAKDVQDRIISASAAEEEDFGRSDFEPNLKVLRGEQNLETSKPSAESDNTIMQNDEAFPDDLVALDRDPTQPTTFKELFGANMAASDLASAPPSASKTEAVSRSRIYEFLWQLEEVKRLRKLDKAKAIFLRLFTLQSELPSEVTSLHRLCRTGWRILLGMHIELGSYQELSAFLDTYSNVYGLHDADRLICLLKHFISKDQLDVASDLWNDAVANNLADERGYTILARKFSMIGSFNRACSLLDAAWNQALEASDFKITRVYYEAAAEVYIRAGMVEKLSELLTRLSANKPLVGERFFVKLFLAINSTPTLKPKEAKNSSKMESPTKPETPEEASSISIQQQQPLPMEVKEQMFKMVEEVMQKMSVPMTTALKNETIFFKLHTLSDTQQLFQTLGQYIAAPDVTTLDLMLRVLLHNGKYDTAGMILDAWDAQFGLKPAASTSRLVSQHLMDLIARSLCSLESDVAHANTEHSKGKVKKSKDSVNPYGLQSPVYEMLDHFYFLGGKGKLRLDTTAWQALTEYILAVESKITSGKANYNGYPGIRLGLQRYRKCLISTRHNYFAEDPLFSCKLVELVIEAGFPVDAFHFAYLLRPRLPANAASRISELELKASSMTEETRFTIWRWYALRKLGVKLSDQQFFFYFQSLSHGDYPRPHYIALALKTFVKDHAATISKWTYAEACRLAAKVPLDNAFLAALNDARLQARLPWSSYMARSSIQLLEKLVLPTLSKEAQAALRNEIADLEREGPFPSAHKQLDEARSAKVEAVVNKYMSLTKEEDGEEKANGRWMRKSKNVPEYGKFPDSFWETTNLHVMLTNDGYKARPAVPVVAPEEEEETPL